MTEIPVVLIGHKDHGKSTLIGRLLLDTGSVKKSRYKEVQEVVKSWGKEFELAHLVDSLKEERENEMTIDTTRVIINGKSRKYQLIDVPGHAELISNMLTGSSDAEAALLLVAIDEGIKEQTKQHLEIAKLLGIEQLGVVINKMDKVDFQVKKFEKIVKELKEILNKIGYATEKINFFPIVAKDGENIVKKSKKMPWYKGKTLIEFLESEIKELFSLESLELIFIIQDNYNGVLVGKIEQGILRKNQEIQVLPDKKIAKIISIQDSTGELAEAKTGENVGILLSENLDFARGRVITSLNSNLKISNQISGEVFWIEKPSQENLILECGTVQCEGELEGPRNVRPKTKTNYQILLNKPIVFQPKGKTILGKIVLKDKGEIIGVGNIL